jgi:hypothetical protein
MPSVKTQRTPNPNAMKFTLDRRVVEGTAARSFSSAQAAQGHALAQRLFALAGVSNVFMADDFVTVTKDAAVGWDELVPRVVAVLEEEFA